MSHLDIDVKVNIQSQYEEIEKQIRYAADTYLIQWDEKDIDYDALDVKIQEYETILCRFQDLGGYWEQFEYTLEELKDELSQLESEVLCKETEADDRCKERREERAKERNQDESTR